MKKPELLTPAPALSHARIRPRIAPAPRIGAGLGGWLEWQLVDRRGRVVQGGEQHNLFLNAGLDSLATYGNPLAGAEWMTHACVGTGSTEPDVADLTLANEIARSNTLVSGLSSTTRETDGVYTLTRQWEFGFNQANGNLTEFGIARASVGQLIVRELIRDAGGTPIALTKTSDFILRITYTLQVTLTPTVATPVAIVIDGIGPVGGMFMWKGGSGAAQGVAARPDLSVFGHVARGTITGAGAPRSGQAFAFGGAGSAAINDSYTQNIDKPPAWTTARPDDTAWSAYTAGDYERTTTPRFGVGQANFFPITGVAISGTTGTTDYMGYVFRINEEDRFEKDADHVLELALLTVTWGRDT